MNEEIVLKVNDLHVSFKTSNGKVKAVRGVSFDLKNKETLAIVGESGSGKSVTSKTIMGILSSNAIIDSGEILFEGKDLTKAKESYWQKIRGKKIGMIFQDPMSSLNPIMKVGKQITEPMRLKLGMKKKEAYKRAIELMEDVGIPHAKRRFNQYPFQFSGGMRQRIVIAIALASNPDILICDEPTTALDVTVQAQILELINNIKEKHSISVIFITHDLGVVANMADRVAVMYAGKFVEKATVDEIFYNPKHPYTWALLSSMPDLDSKDELYAIPGTPPNMIKPPKGDAFALRSEYAMEIDFEEEPPMFKVSDTHEAATWLLHPTAPKVDLPEILTKRINNMKDTSNNETVAINSLEKPTYTEKVLEINGLKQHFSAGKGRKKFVVKAVDDVSFDVYKGECFGIVGESGCGKTTTGRTILKLYQNTSGLVKYEDKIVSLGLDDVERKVLQLKSEIKVRKKEYSDTKKVSIKQEILVKKALIRKYKRANKMDKDFLVGVQMIFQDPVDSLNPRMTVREIIGEGMRVLGVKNLIVEDGYTYKPFKSRFQDGMLQFRHRFLGKFSKKVRANIEKRMEEKRENEKGIYSKKEYMEMRVKEILKTVGLMEEHASRYPHEFSGGQRQRIGIARALIMNPKVIIADEPISALDVSIQASVINLLKKLQKDLGLTIIFIAHDLSVVKYFSDRIAVMYSGKIVEQASSEELFKNPMHPYTKSLLSAVPLPNPDYERNRKRFVYDPSLHPYSNEEQPSFVNIGNEHYIYASKTEIQNYKEQIS